MLLRSLKLGTALLVVAPLAVGTPDSTRVDSSSLRFYLGGGGGHYAAVSRGCNNEVLLKEQQTFREMAGSIEHQRGKARFGLRGGWIDDDLYDNGYNLYISPYGAFDGRLFSYELGFFGSKERLRLGDNEWSEGDLQNLFTARVRIGRVQGPYVSLGWFDEVPLYTAGYAHAGLGGRPHPKLELWGGISTLGPYDGTGPLLKVAYRPVQSLGLHVDTRLGKSEGIDESAITVGLKAHWPR